jgi:hypothetical protein
MKKIFILVLASIPFTGMAQSDDFGIYNSLDVVKTVSHRLKIDVGAEYRSHDNVKSTDRYSFGLSVDYKLSSWLSVGTGYDLLNDNVDSPGENYWRKRHRLHFDFIDKLILGRMILSLRERWQYTYRPEKTIEDQNVFVPGVGDNVLRSRIKLEYSTNTFVAPYVSVEMYNGWRIEKMKYIAGVDLCISANDRIALYYMYQALNSSEQNINVIAVGYRYVF